MPIHKNDPFLNVTFQSVVTFKPCSTGWTQATPSIYYKLGLSITVKLSINLGWAQLVYTIKIKTRSLMFYRVGGRSTNDILFEVQDHWRMHAPGQEAPQM